MSILTSLNSLHIKSNVFLCEKVSHYSGAMSPLITFKTRKWNSLHIAIRGPIPPNTLLKVKKNSEYHAKELFFLKL